jgi:hypothetical protein
MNGVKDKGNAGRKCLRKGKTMLKKEKGEMFPLRHVITYNPIHISVL